MTIFVKNSDLKLPARREKDQYFTPPWIIHQALTLIHGIPERVLDPGCGPGAWGEITNETWPFAEIWGIEIDETIPRNPSYDGWLCADFLQWQPNSTACTFDLVIGNPPYALAGEFVEKGLSHLHFGGHLIYLLTLSFLASRERTLGIFAKTPPYEVVVTQRPSFENCGTSQPRDFALFHWVQGWQGETRVRWLAKPKEPKPLP